MIVRGDDFRTDPLLAHLRAEAQKPGIGDIERDPRPVCHVLACDLACDIDLAAEVQLLHDGTKRTGPILDPVVSGHITLLLAVGDDGVGSVERGHLRGLDDAHSGIRLDLGEQIAERCVIEGPCGDIGLLLEQLEPVEQPTQGCEVAIDEADLIANLPIIVGDVLIAGRDRQRVVGRRLAGIGDHALRNGFRRCRTLGGSLIFSGHGCGGVSEGEGRSSAIPDAAAIRARTPAAGNAANGQTERRGREGVMPSNS